MIYLLLIPIIYFTVLGRAKKQKSKNLRGSGRTLDIERARESSNLYYFLVVILFLILAIYIYLSE